MLSVRLRGFDKLISDFEDADERLDRPLRSALLASAVIVQAAAQRKVHSPDNPWPDAARSVATGRLQASMGIGDIEGSGLNLHVRVGHPHGKAAFAGGAFGRLTPSGRRTRRGKPIGRHTGHRVNRGDVTVYGPIEEQRHPFLGPSVEFNRARIADLIRRRVEQAMGRFGK